MRSVNLDELMPEKGEVIINGNKYEFDAPKTGQLIRVVSHFQSFQESFNAKNPDEADKSMSELEIIIKEIIPELSDINLSFNQVVSIANLISEISMPDDNEKLKEAGVTIESIKKDQAV